MRKLYDEEQNKLKAFDFKLDPSSKKFKPAVKINISDD